MDKKKIGFSPSQQKQISGLQLKDKLGRYIITEILFLVRFSHNEIK